MVVVQTGNGSSTAKPTARRLGISTVRDINGNLTPQITPISAPTMPTTRPQSYLLGGAIIGKGTGIPVSKLDADTNHNAYQEPAKDGNCKIDIDGDDDGDDDHGPGGVTTNGYKIGKGDIVRVRVHLDNRGKRTDRQPPRILGFLSGRPRIDTVTGPPRPIRQRARPKNKPPPPPPRYSDTHPGTRVASIGVQAQTEDDMNVDADTVWVE